MDDRRRQFEAQALPHLDAAYNLARWLTRSPTDAEDIVQDAMLRAFKSFDGFRGDNARAWLLAIVRNCSRNLHADSRRRAHEPLRDSDDTALASTDTDPEAASMEASRNRRLDALLLALPAEFREVLILREMEDLSYREIAEIADIPIGTVMSRLARARTLLREKLQEEACP